MTFAARWLVSPPIPFNFEDRHGQGRHHQDQARLERRHRVLVRHQEELAYDDREAEDEEVRPDREEARRIRRGQDQVSPRPLCDERRAPWGALFISELVARTRAQTTSARHRFVFLEKEVAGRERCHEEATRIAPDRPNPTELRRCGGPECSAGLSFWVAAALEVNPTPLSASGRRPSSERTLLHRAPNATLKSHTNAGFAKNRSST